MIKPFNDNGIVSIKTYYGLSNLFLSAFNETCSLTLMLFQFSIYFI